MVINPIAGVYIPIIRIPIKGGMTIPNIATFDHGTNGFFCTWDGHGHWVIGMVWSWSTLGYDLRLELCSGGHFLTGNYERTLP